jgi:hypothetical protein
MLSVRIRKAVEWIPGITFLIILTFGPLALFVWAGGWWFVAKMLLVLIGLGFLMFLVPHLIFWWEEKPHEHWSNRYAVPVLEGVVWGVVFGLPLVVLLLRPEVFLFSLILPGIVLYGMFRKE